MIEHYDRDETLPVDILVGIDQFYSLVTDVKIRGPVNSPVAVQTHFGWILHGNIGSPSSICCSTSTSLFVESTTSQTLWTEEIPDDDEQHAFECKVDIENSRFVVNLPWKSNDERPVNNKKLVTSVQHHIDSKMSHDKLLRREAYFDDHLSRGFVEHCHEDATPSHYMPHMSITQKDKLRVVLNGSFGKQSLNSYLQTGPNLFASKSLGIVCQKSHSEPL